MRLYVLAAAALCALLWGQAHAQSPTLPGFPPGTFQNRAALDGGSASSACSPNVCPGDISGWGTAYAAYSLRCFTFAYAGNVARIRNVGTPATQTLLSCSGGVVSASVNALATTCATSCELYIWYDQSGNGRTLDTVAGGAFPTFVASSFAGQYSATFAAGNLISGAVNATAQAQPITVAAAVQFTGTGTIFADGSTGFYGLYSLFGNNRAQKAGGSRIDYTGTDSTLESIISVINGGSSSMKINGGSITSSGSPGTNGIANTNKLTIGAGSDVGGDLLTGNVYEVIVVAGAVGSTDQASMVTNQRTIGTGW